MNEDKKTMSLAGFMMLSRMVIEEVMKHPEAKAFIHICSNLDEAFITIPSDVKSVVGPKDSLLAPAQPQEEKKVVIEKMSLGELIKYVVEKGESLGLRRFADEYIAGAQRTYVYVADTKVHPELQLLYETDWSTTSPRVYVKDICYTVTRALKADAIVVIPIKVGGKLEE